MRLRLLLRGVRFALSARLALGYEAGLSLNVVAKAVEALSDAACVVEAAAAASLAYDTASAAAESAMEAALVAVTAADAASIDSEAGIAPEESSGRRCQFWFSPVRRDLRRGAGVVVGAGNR